MLFIFFVITVQMAQIQMKISTVSDENLQFFFKNTYDIDNNGYADIDQFLNYYKFLEPEQNITLKDVQTVFQYYDNDGNMKVSFQELYLNNQAPIQKKSYLGPKQLRLGLTNSNDQMQIMWVSTPDKYYHPVVQYGRSILKLQKSQQASIDTYNVGHIGFHGSIYRAVMKGLLKSQKYYYRVGDLETNIFSTLRWFISAPQHEQKLINLAVFADMGTYAPYGHRVMRQIVINNLQNPYDLILLTGDIAYAGMNSQKVGQVQPIWDLFGQLSEPFTSYIPFIAGVGNHEKYYNYTAYRHRYFLPKQYDQQPNFWFYLDYAQLRIIHISSEHNFTMGSQQYIFLQKALKQGRSNGYTKWIMVCAHRPFYCSDQREYHEITPLATALEDLLHNYTVDIVQNGHDHLYERTWPIFKGKAYKDGQNDYHYSNPKYPIYVVQGTSGALIKDQWINPTPEWSVKRIKKYGYGRLMIHGDRLTYQFISLPSGQIQDEWHLTKDL